MSAVVALKELKERISHVKSSLVMALKKLKGRLSHVKSSSWHFQFVEMVWKEGARNSKACSYYWVKFPTSMLIVLLVLCLVGVVYPVGWFLGFQFKFSAPKSGEYNEGGELFYPYKTTRKGKKVRFAPWEIAMGICWALIVILVAHHLVFNDPALGVGILTYGALTVALVTLCVLLWPVLRKKATSSDRPRLRLFSFRGSIDNRLTRNLSSFWDRVCPKLIVDE